MEGILGYLMSSPSSMYNIGTSKKSCIELQIAVQALQSPKDIDKIEALLQAMMPCFLPLSVSVYGNYFVQMMVDRLDRDQMGRVIKEIDRDIPSLAMDAKGVFCLQRILKRCSVFPECITLYFNTIVPYVPTLAQDMYGGYLLRDLINMEDIHYPQSILSSLENKFLQVCTHKYGIIVCKYLLSRLSTHRPSFEKICRLFAIHSPKACADSHFNFGIILILEIVNEKQWDIQDVETVIGIFLHRHRHHRLRSRAVLQTLLTAMAYHNSYYLESFILPSIPTLFCVPLTTGEIDIIKSIELACPRLRVQVQLLKRIIRCIDQ